MKIEVAGYALNPNAIVGIGPVRNITPTDGRGLLMGDTSFGFDLITIGKIHTIRCTAEALPSREMQNMEEYQTVVTRNRKTAEDERAKVVDAVFQ